MKKVIILGGGESGVGAALLAQKVGDQPFVSDAGSISAQYQAQLQENGIAFEAGGHSIDSFFDADLIVKSPGIPGHVPVLEQLRRRGKPILSEIEYGYRHCHARILAITGSNGKTTTASLAYHLMQLCGETAWLGGNIGTSFSALVAKDEQPAWYVLEVSSFQLDDIDTFRPDVGVLLNITPDHLDRYEGSIDQYAAAKLRISENQRAEDVFIYNREDRETCRRLHWIEGRPSLRSFGLKGAPAADAWLNQGLLTLREDSGQLGFSSAEMHLLGPHNQLNAMAAILAVRAASGCETGIRQGLTSFQPIAHRLEPVATHSEVRYLNDSKATNVDAVKYALEAMAADQVQVIWLAGGIDKGNDYEPLKRLVAEQVRAVVFLGEYLLDQFRREFPDKSIYPVGSMAEAIQVAQQLAQPGDTVLLSPACASFDLFKNYEDRGAQFKQEVAGLGSAPA
jgi:UDP-N-acetylmuramoylalanine--D-glutamate ligase